jgi:hypothetical protein
MDKPADQPASGKYEELRFALRVLLLFTVAIGGFLLLVSLRGRAGSTAVYKAKLPDGTFLVVRAVTTGKSHSVEIPYSLYADAIDIRQSHADLVDPREFTRRDAGAGLVLQRGANSARRNSSAPQLVSTAGESAV